MWFYKVFWGLSPQRGAFTIPVKLWKISSLIDHFCGLSNPPPIKSVRIKTTAESIRWSKQEEIQAESKHYVCTGIKYEGTASEEVLGNITKFGKIYFSITVAVSRYWNGSFKLKMFSDILQEQIRSILTPIPLFHLSQLWIFFIWKVRKSNCLLISGINSNSWYWRRVQGHR